MQNLTLPELKTAYHLAYAAVSKQRKELIAQGVVLPELGITEDLWRLASESDVIDRITKLADMKKTLEACRFVSKSNLELVLPKLEELLGSDWYTRVKAHRGELDPNKECTDNPVELKPSLMHQHPGDFVSGELNLLRSTDAVTLIRVEGPCGVRVYFNCNSIDAMEDYKDRTGHTATVVSSITELQACMGEDLIAYINTGEINLKRTVRRSVV